MIIVQSFPGGNHGIILLDAALTMETNILPQAATHQLPQNEDSLAKPSLATPSQAKRTRR
jgi:hypothetical protein